MANSPVILSGLHQIARDYDALVCDVWGVLHNGSRAYAPAVDALKRFRTDFGPVVLLSNAPRPVDALEEQFRKFGVPGDCYDAIVTSGVAARADLARRTEGGRLAIYHLGPERDRGVFEGLPIDCVEPEKARVVLCTGLFNDDTETPDDYHELLDVLRRRGLAMLCANPDIVVQRGGQLVYCAGAIARAYEKIGGSVVYYGKPYTPIYKPVLDAARAAARRDIVRPLAVGDGLETDIRGADNAGMDSLFIADGIHGEEIGDVTESSLARLFGRAKLSARAAMRALVW
ncbi:MAG TPA: TIGR01459 family HAD-type hydrolase [Rhizomicrobium sp.]|nr:TIGR01459 family HAD-type hydrolase [Rhizomicrobium sp.]